jgi:hypothetical protein
MTGVGAKEKLLSLHFFTQPMSIRKIYLPNPVEIYKLITQPKEKYHITIIISEKSKVDHSKLVPMNAQVMSTLMLLTFWMMKYKQSLLFYRAPLFCFPNPQGSKIFIYPTFYAFEFLFTHLRPQPHHK